MPVYRPFLTVDENGKWPQETNDWIQRVFTESQYSFVKDCFGGILIQDSGYLETNKFLVELRNYLQTQCDFLTEHFEFESVQCDGEIHYRNYKASNIIFCEGCAVNNNPLFNWLPIRKLKGELLTIKGALPRDVIVNRGIFSLPVSTNEFILGSTYVHDENDGATFEGKEEILSRAKKLFTSALEIMNHTWGHRPTTLDRRPILGSHPEHKNVCIFNGLGTKGVSLAPFFALHLADWLEGHRVLNKEINIERFYSLSFKSKWR
jgi:glycine/D-amino acid oxidase-like deaminating enzyme